jgi:antitoxin component of MazEF toxin-antitoxin module
MTLKIEKSGDDFFVYLPKDAVSTLDWSHGDIVTFEVVDGSLRVTRAMTAHDRAMEIAREAMVKYRDTLEFLAKN